MKNAKKRAKKTSTRELPQLPTENFQVTLKRPEPQAISEGASAVAEAASSEPLAALLPYLQQAQANFKVVRKGRLLKFQGTGVEISGRRLALLLEGLPRRDRLEGSLSRKGKGLSLSFHGKLSRGRLSPPKNDGLILVWTDPPPELDALERLLPPRVSVSPRPKLQDESPPPNEVSVAAGVGLAQALLASPKFRNAHRAQGGGPLSLTQVGEFLDFLAQGGHRQATSALQAQLGKNKAQWRQALGQLELLFAAAYPPGLSSSLDGEWLYLHPEAIEERYQVKAEMPPTEDLVEATTLDGSPRSFQSPIPLDAKERLLIAALLRYGTLSERELSQNTGSRRIAGLIERLSARLQEAGCFALEEVGSSEEGRLFRMSLWR